MCGKPLLGYIIHSFATYLHFNPLAVVSHQRNMKGLIAIGFGVAYPIAQSVGMRFVYLGYGYIYVETVVQFFFLISRIKNNTHSE
ncbi:hypothetical protein SDC9_119727 [bioreactor metagenome]|uniref:Uncharacterized protein n=1 Tax=bioreactor metagenome TaxID=1076179 RepID=A0A645C6Y4_9ZZZZ